MHDDADLGPNYEIWVQDLTDCNLFHNRIMGLKLPESALQGRPNTVLKIRYDREGPRVLPLGYFWQVDDEIIVDPVGADAVRLVFELRGRGLSIEKIAQKLGGIPNPRGGVVWHASNIREILENEDTYRSGLLNSDSSLHLPPILK
jgi:hypothetical protein